MSDTAGKVAARCWWELRDKPVGYWSFHRTVAALIQEALDEVKREARMRMENAYTAGYDNGYVDRRRERDYDPGKMMPGFYEEEDS